MANQAEKPNVQTVHKLLAEANILRKSGALKVALECYNECIGIYRQLVAEGRKEQRVNLADALHNRGNVLDDSGALTDTLASYDESIGIYRVVVAEGQKERRANLANALTQKAVILERQQMLSEAIACYEEIMSSQVDQERQRKALEKLIELKQRGSAGTPREEPPQEGTNRSTGAIPLATVHPPSVVET